MKVRSRDEEKAWKTRPLTTVNVGTPGEPTPNQTGQIPARRANAMLGTVKMTIPESLANDWATDINESNGLSPVVSMDMRPTEHIDKATTEVSTLPLLVAYGPHDLSALCSGTQNPWATLSHRHHRHHRPQPPHEPSVFNSTTRTPWNSDHHRHPHFYPPHPPPPCFDPPSHLMPAYIVEIVRHLQGIPPTKPIVCITSPAPTPISIFEMFQHPHGISPTKSRKSKRIPINSKENQKKYTGNLLRLQEHHMT